MSEFDGEGIQTIAQMWETFIRGATRNRPGRKVPIEVRVAYYAGCHSMLDNILKTLHTGEANPGSLAPTWQRWSDELFQFLKDYGEGKYDKPKR